MFDTLFVFEPDFLFLFVFELNNFLIFSFSSVQNTLKTPVYVTSQRRNAMGVGLVFEADLHTTEHTSHWILQGVCLILNTD